VNTPSLVQDVHMHKEPLICPWCGRKTVLHREGIFRWRKCSAPKSCGWDVFKDAEREA